MKRIVLVLAMFLGASAQATATEAPTAELGRQLFHSSELGESGKSCATCHPGGKGLEGIGAYTDDQLREMINVCIRDALKGEPLGEQSQELASMLLYLRSQKP